MHNLSGSWVRRWDHTCEAYGLRPEDVQDSFGQKEEDVPDFFDDRTRAARYWADRLDISTKMAGHLIDLWRDE